MFVLCVSAHSPGLAFAGGAPAGDTQSRSCMPLPEQPRDKALYAALELYDRQQYPEALERFRRIVEDREFKEAERQRAAFNLGKTLFRLRLFVGALSTFSEIAASGPNHEYYFKAMEWLASITQVLTPEMGAGAALSHYPLPTFDRPMLGPLRDTVLVEVARTRLRERNPKAALEALAYRKKESYEPVPQKPALDGAADELERAARALLDGGPDAGAATAAIGPDASEHARTLEALRAERTQIDALPTICQGRTVPWLRGVLEKSERAPR